MLNQLLSFAVLNSCVVGRSSDSAPSAMPSRKHDGFQWRGVSPCCDAQCRQRKPYSSGTVRDLHPILFWFLLRSAHSETDRCKDNINCRHNVTVIGKILRYLLYNKISIWRLFHNVGYIYIQCVAYQTYCFYGQIGSSCLYSAEIGTLYVATVCNLLYREFLVAPYILDALCNVFDFNLIICHRVKKL